MSKKSLIQITVCICIIYVTGAASAQVKDLSAAPLKEKGATLTIEGRTITLEQAIDLVLENNLTLQSAKYDVIMSDSDFLRSQNKYSTRANLEGSYTNQRIPPTGLAAITGDKSYQYDMSASLSKMFNTGTNVSAGVQETFFDANDPGIPGLAPSSPAYHKPSLFVSAQQEILKNAFGYYDRSSDRIKKNAAAMQRAAIVDQLSGLVVSTLVEYWTITVRKASVENARLELESDRQVRDIIARNVRFGLGEAYDLNQFNALVATAETRHAVAEQGYRESVRKLIRTMNMPVDTRVEGITDLIDALPVLNAEEAIKAGFAKRVDYRNASMMLENAKMELAMHENNSMPSLSVGLKVSTLGQDEQINAASTDAATGRYPTWQVGARLSYPFDDTELETNLRNARLKLKQQKILLDQARLEVRDGIMNSLEQVKLQHGVLGKSRTARAESELYYQRALARFRQGKITSVTVKLALDAMVQSRQQELESLVQYNVSLLQFDLAKNEIFERYNVDVEKYLKRVKE